ncbi:hypothetical protein ABFX02_13G156200 [Erythranthe guttata]
MNPNKKRENDDLPLFETKAARGGAAHKLFCSTIFAGIILTWAYRLTHIPESRIHVWFSMFFSEVFFGLYWIITQSARWHVVSRHPFKDRLSLRYGEEELPKVDIFVCTADPVLEPPSLVVGTVLSAVSYNYPPEKLAVYLSDDGGSELTFFALLEASRFSKHWVPFCKKYNVEPRSPRVYFSRCVDVNEFDQEWINVKQLYEDMESRIESVARKGCVPQEIKDRHKGFSEWESNVTKQDHQSIVQILIDGCDQEAIDIEGNKLPTLVYLSREKKTGCAHNFKAGSMNALLRVSAEISNAPIILNVDCDMYSNDPDSIRDALCFFLDEKQGKQISYVQYPQQYNNIIENDIYANINLAINQIELSGLDGFGGTLYVGTGCFHRRVSLSGEKYSGIHTIECLNDDEVNTKKRSVEELEEASKVLANCSYENGTLWGQEMGLVYGCPVEDIVTGLTIQCRGWKPVYYNPAKYAFEGVAPTTLDVSLIQFKRWSEGMFQIFFSKYCPFVYGHRKIEFGAQMGYCIYLLWAPISLPTLCYVVVPALSLLHGVPLFPQISSPWFLPFAYVFGAKTAYTLVEALIIGDTLKGWWNLQRMVLIRRTTSFFFAFVDTMIRQFGLSQTSFVVTSKSVDDHEARDRYEKGLIEFGSSSVTTIIIATIALLNFVSLVCGLLTKLAFGDEFGKFVAQLAICAVLVMLNLPIYEAIFLRSDRGKIPSSVAVKAFVVASILCLLRIY